MRTPRLPLSRRIALLRELQTVSAFALSLATRTAVLPLVFRLLVIIRLSEAEGELLRLGDCVPIRGGSSSLSGIRACARLQSLPNR